MSTIPRGKPGEALYGIGPWMGHDLCGACTSGLHASCPDPFGDLAECPCSELCGQTGEIHRLQHEQWDTSDGERGDDSGKDAEGHDGGLGSRRHIDRWEFEEARFEDALRERA